MQRTTWRPLAAGGLCALAGCASVVEGQRQPVAVQAVGPAGRVAGALCRLANDRGTWDLVTPGEAELDRSRVPLAVRCEREGYEPTVLSIPAGTQGMTYGNLLIGGLVGAVFDVSSGAAYRYPEVLTVAMVPRPGIAPVPPAEVTPRVPLAAGDRFDYELEDRFTGQKRRVQRLVAEADGERVAYAAGDRVETATGRALALASPTLGDLDLFEPPQGWLPEQPMAGLVERLSYRARDGSPGSRVDLKLRLLPAAPLRTAAGEFLAWPLEAEGYAARPQLTGQEVQHALRMTIWIDAATLRPLRAESALVSAGPSSMARNSRERVELVARERAGGVAFPAPATHLPAATPAAVTPIALAPGDLFEYELVDRFTGHARRLQRRVDAVAGDEVRWNQGDRVEALDGRPIELRPATLLGDAEAFEPPRGWLPAVPRAGLQEELSYAARDGARPSRVRLTLRTSELVPVQTDFGPVPAWVMVGEGFALRWVETVEMQHRLALRVWVDARTRRVLRFESEILPQGLGSQVARPSRERLELKRFRR